MNNDTTEPGLETLINEALVGDPDYKTESGDTGDRLATYDVGRLHGDAQDYDREYSMDLNQLSMFLGLTARGLRTAHDVSSCTNPTANNSLLHIDCFPY